MRNPQLVLARLCANSDELDFIADGRCNDGTWLLWNRAGIVVGRGATPLEACQDLLGDCQVVR